MSGARRARESASCEPDCSASLLGASRSRSPHARAGLRLAVVVPATRSRLGIHETRAKRGEFSRHRLGTRIHGRDASGHATRRSRDRSTGPVSPRTRKLGCNTSAQKEHLIDPFAIVFITFPLPHGSPLLGSGAEAVIESREQRDNARRNAVSRVGGTRPSHLALAGSATPPLFSLPLSSPPPSLSLSLHPPVLVVSPINDKPSPIAERGRANQRNNSDVGSRTGLVTQHSPSLLRPTGMAGHKAQDT